MGDLTKIADVGTSARFVRAIIGMFPDSDPEEDWTRQALGIAKRFPDPVLFLAHGKLLATGWRKLPALPLIEELCRDASDELQHKADVDKTGVPLEANYIRRKAWDILRHYAERNMADIRAMTERGWGALILSELIRQSRIAAQSPDPKIVLGERFLSLTEGQGPGVAPHRFQNGLVPDDVYAWFCK